MGCLQVNLCRVTQPLTMSISLSCSSRVIVGIPLLVDEGYLFVDYNGRISIIYVDKDE